MDTTSAVEGDWPYVLALMPAGLEESARDFGALQRRRGVASAGDLLRLALVYAVCDGSLRETAAWAGLAGVAEVSDVALLKRLRGAREWLGHLVVGFLAERGLSRPGTRLPVRVVDATTVSRPGSRGVDWRLHLGLDLATQRITTVELTGVEGGETLSRHAVIPGEVLLGDRGYAHRPGAAAVLNQGGHFVVRVAWRGFPLETAGGRPVDLVELAESLEVGEVSDWTVWFREGGRRYEARWVALRKTEVAAERERRRLTTEARRKGKQVSPKTLRAAAFVYVLTDLPREVAGAREVLELYLLRWQIEMTFKRLKGIHQFDHLRARDPDLAATYLYAKLLGALVVDELAQQATFSPWGYPLRRDRPQSLAGRTAVA